MAKVLRRIVEIDEDLCDGCGICVEACKEGAIQIVNGKAKLVEEKLCDGLGVCIGHCPKGAIRFVEKEAEEFEEPHHQPFVCPGSKLRELEKKPSKDVDIPSALTHWPVQIRLIPPTAPFLKGADLLVVADCVPVAYPKLHADLLVGKKALLGCPKFDPYKEYLDRFTDIFTVAKPKSVTVAVMEVPCCQGLVRTVVQARNISKSSVPIEVVVVSVDGEIVHRERV